LIAMSTTKLLLTQSPVLCAVSRSGLHSRRRFGTSIHLNADGSHIPRVAEASFWRNLIPKALRRDDNAVGKQKSKAWNPATPFIVLGLVVGSFAINILSLKRDMLNFSRKTEARLETLREVLQRLKNGEDVDVEKLLGTGDAKQEKEWEDVMQELESTDMLLDAQKRNAAKVAEREARRIADNEQSPKAPRAADDTDPGQSAKGGRPKFMM
jgi:hypothetical protein